MSKTINLQAAVLAVAATITTLMGVQGVAAYEHGSAVASLQTPVTLAAASVPHETVQQVVVVGRRVKA